MKSESPKVHPDAADNDNVAQRPRQTKDGRAALRAHSKRVRRGLTDTLQQHGVASRQDFGRITNTGYLCVLGYVARKLKAQRDLGRRGSLRDTLTDSELSAVMFAETLASERIKAEESQGVRECDEAMARSGRNVAKLRATEKADHRPKRARAANDADDKSSAA
jgi:hypothetical protein